MSSRVRSGRMKISLVWGTLTSLWGGAIVCGMLLLAWHDFSPGDAVEAPKNWPAATQISRSNRVANLIMFAHPRCPCTRASLGELEKIVARNADKINLWIVFHMPGDPDVKWAQTDIVSAAKTIPGAHVLLDVDGAEARRFDCNTSGQTLLYSSTGKLLFAGGITFARGHAGDNEGRWAIESILNGRTPAVRDTPAFGCPIADSGSEGVRS